MNSKQAIKEFVKFYFFKLSKSLENPETIYPFCIIARQLTSKLCPLIVFKHSKVSLSHILIVLSHDPETIIPFCIIARQ
ncbi:hypothetical protein BpHYR1_024101 [Brachionus plicatilis]|uniref:Uncharacterized protein n=1 Tax=Brachionus plicatilis TaxID=10195 RepID=A0A3M7PSX3_BRAPC|nr:hypothetical protein BpHYR1_024101 [Brachionus plicatilis]